MTAHRKLPVWATAFESWRFLLRRPQATLLTIVLAVSWLHAVLGTASLLSYTSGRAAFGAGADGHGIDMLTLTVSGTFALSGWLVLAAIVMVIWLRAVLRQPGAARWTNTGPLARAVGRSALILAGLGALWFVSVALFGVPFGSRPGLMIVVEAQPEMIAEDGVDRFLDPWLLPLFGILVVCAYVPIRLALWLPAIGLDRALDLRAAWALGRGNGWRLVAAVLLTLLPVWLAGAVLDPPYVLSPDRDWLWWTRNELDRSLNGLVFALAGVVLAPCYRAVGGNDAGPTATASPTASH